MNFLLLLVLPAITSFVITYCGIPSIIKVARQKGLFDEPNEIRKIHRTSIPTLGGVAIFAGVLISATIYIDFTRVPGLSYGVAALLLLFFTGVKDDIIPLSPNKKLIAELLAAGIIVIRCDIRLTSMYGFCWVYELSYPVSILLSIFTLLVIINAMNLIDGINGLAGGIGLIVSAVFGYLFYLMGQMEMALLTFALCGALIGFLRFNLTNQAQIFMGDTGSLIIGLLLGIFTIKFIELNRITGTLFHPEFAPIFAFSLLIIPLYDTLRVFVVRLNKGKSPFSGDRNHLHHLLIDSGLDHWQASILLYHINILFVVFTLLFRDISYPLLCLGILGCSVVLSGLLFQLKQRKDLAEQKINLQQQANMSKAG